MTDTRTLTCIPVSTAFAAALEDAGLWDWWLKNRGHSWRLDAEMPALHEAAKEYRQSADSPQSTRSLTPISQSLRQLQAPVVSTMTASKRLHVTTRAVLKMIESGRLTARRDGYRWLVDSESIERIRKG